MIALDTNALVRLLVEDEKAQAARVKGLVEDAESVGRPILLLTEVVLETVWVLESAYNCSRSEVVEFLTTLLGVSIFHLPDRDAVRTAIARYKDTGDFADHLIVGLSRFHKANALFSFDRKLKKLYPKYVSSA